MPPAVVFAGDMCTVNMLVVNKQMYLSFYRDVKRS